MNKYICTLAFIAASGVSFGDKQFINQEQFDELTPEEQNNFSVYNETETLDDSTDLNVDTEENGVEEEPATETVAEHFDEEVETVKSGDVDGNW